MFCIYGFKFPGLSIGAMIYLFLVYGIACKSPIHSIMILKGNPLDMKCIKKKLRKKHGKSECVCTTC